MSKRKTTGDTVVKSLIVAAIVIAVLAVSFLVAWYCTGGGWFGGQVPPTFTVTVEGQEYGKSFSKQILYSGTEIEVNRPLGEDYTVEITATQTSNVVVQTGESLIKWAELDADFNKGFEIIKADDRFTVQYTSFEDIVTKATGLTEFEISGETSDELFQMRVACANSEIIISFGVSFPVGGLEFDNDHIIFTDTEQGGVNHE